MVKRAGKTTFPSVGDTVWVKTGWGSHEEPGKVLEVGCAFTYQSDDGSERSDGILVHLQISKERGVFAPSAVRPFDDEPNTKTSSRTRSEPAVVTKAKTSRANLVTPCDTDDTGKRKSCTSRDTQETKRKKTSETIPEKAKTSKLLSETIKPASTSSSEASPVVLKEVTKTKQVVSNPLPSKIAVKPANLKAEASESEENDEDDDVDTDDEADDKPFKVEYSTTGRATCRRCDEVIKKGELRISHVPLFRGKPGYTVYRHLDCAVFSEEVKSAEDVGGWRKLNKSDRELVALRVEESKMEVQRENEELEPDELVPTVFQGEIRGPPAGLNATLLPFQVEGASWMRHQEVFVTGIHGGILADEMGMGKTIQTIACILDNKPFLQHSKPGAKFSPAFDRNLLVAEDKLWEAALVDWNHEMEMNKIPKSMHPKGKGTTPVGGARAGTLVVCPVVALSQWKSEIEKFTEPSALKVVIYHGPNRASDVPRELLRTYDIVLTTYQVLESDFRKMVSPNRVKCPNCGCKFKIDKLHVHLKYFCGEGAQRTEAQARQRRTADRHGSQSGPGRGNKKSQGVMTKEMTEKAPPTTLMPIQTRKPAKKQLHVKKNLDLESKSDLSVDEDEELPRGRPSRSAAREASSRLSASAKQLRGSKTIKDSDSESAFEAESSEEDESETEQQPSVRLQNKSRVSISSSAGESSSESESEALKRARVKQALAMRNAKIPQKNDGKGKGDKNKGKRNRNGQKGKKKEPKGSDSSSSDDEEKDPLAGIDMDRLLEEAMQGSRMSPLHSFSWWRIVLDEAHFIKSRSSQTAAAAFSLTSIHRWCLSGTPLQNRVGELYSLIRFLRIDPMAHYFCRGAGCGCKSIHYRMVNGRCLGCGHGAIQHFSHFNKHVLNKIQRDGYRGDGRRAMFTLKNEVLDRCLLRRTKETRAEDMNLPPRLVEIRTVRLHPVEEDFYNALYTQTRSSFADYVAQGTLLNNYAHIFDLLTRMRQSVDHPYLIVYSKRNTEGQQTFSGSAEVTNGTTDCEICHEPPTDRVTSSCCGTAFCRSCVIDFMSAAENISHGNTQCPSCRRPFSIDLNQSSVTVVDDGTLTVARGTKDDSFSIPSLKELPHVATGSILRRINLAEFATSTKIEALIEELVAMRQTSPGSKAIVFSQFVNMLDLIRWRLHSDPCLSDLGIGVRALHGGMDVKSRDSSLKDFREDSNVRVLLMSLKAGGVALNLTIANYIYLMDPWWNPAAEMQAIDRTHRLGQHRPIRAIRFVAEGTVEERILQLQEKKRLVFDGTVGRDAGSLQMLTVDDMKALFA